MAGNEFEEAVAEFMERSRDMLEMETSESLPPTLPSPYDQSGPPYEAAPRLDSTFIRNYAASIGDDNPLYTDPTYAQSTRYGSQIAPGPILSRLRGITAHGVQAGHESYKRPEGYPVANFFSGTAWEFYDAIRVGSKFRTSMVTKELFEKLGSRGNLIFFISELFFWDAHGDLPGKCSGTLIMVPVESMGSSRAMSVERLGEQMMYERKSTSYSSKETRDVVSRMEGYGRRGSETLYWEDVKVGDTLGPMVLPPWTLQDQEASHFMTYCYEDGEDFGTDQMAFEPAYYWMRARPRGARVHPVTRWPWGGEVEHEDALMAAYRAQPGPFDQGVQRVQIPQRLITDWMGDDGFIRRLYVAIRKPVYYSDVTVYTGEVVKKFKEAQRGEKGRGAVSGEHEYYAVGIRIQGTNQVGESQAPGTATVYLPSREGGPVQLPVPHPVQPPFVPYQTYYKEWY